MDVKLLAHRVLERHGDSLTVVSGSETVDATVIRDRVARRGEGPEAPQETAAAPARADRGEYWHRASEALDRISALEHACEAVSWLEQTAPARHRWLRVALPAHLDMIWEAGAPLNVFQQVLDRWVAAHQAVVRDWEKTL